MTLVKWNPDNYAIVGELGIMLDDANPKSAREQFNDAYAFAGGWQPFEGFGFDSDTLALKYTGDPPMYPRAQAVLRDERIFLYPSAWVLIWQPNGTWEVARMD